MTAADWPTLEASKNYPTTWEDLAKTTEANGGVYLTYMGVLRKISKAGRLGPIVLDSIKNLLKQHGLGYLPDDLPGNQEQTVMIYQLGTPVAEIIGTVLSTPTLFTEKALLRLNKSVGGPDNSLGLMLGTAIRELLDDHGV